MGTQSPEQHAMTPRTSSDSSRRGSSAEVWQQGRDGGSSANAATTLSFKLDSTDSLAAPDGPDESDDGRPTSRRGGSAGAASSGTATPLLTRVDDDEPHIARGRSHESSTDDDDDDDLLERLPPDEGGVLPGEDDDEAGASNFAQLAQLSQQSWDEGVPDDAHLSRGQRRRVYGGGAGGGAGAGFGADLANMPGGLGVGQVAGLVITSMTSATPLLMPHAAALLGLPLFLAILILTAGLSWFSYIALGMSSRYVGAKSWAGLTSAVFPHRLKMHKVGEVGVSALVIFCSLARGLVCVLAAADLLVQLFTTAPASRTTRARLTATLILSAVWFLLPLLVLATARTTRLRRRLANSNFVTLPPYLSFFLWPISLLIVGVRLKRLNADDDGSIPAEPGHEVADPMGLTVWAGVSIVVFALSAHQDCFKFLTSLARPPSTSSRSPSMASRRDDAGFRQGRRNQWPIAAGLGVGAAALIQLGWGLVGYLGVRYSDAFGGLEADIFASRGLPRRDGWLAVARMCALVATLGGLESALEGAYARVRKLIDTVVVPSSSDARSRGYARMMNAQDSLVIENKSWLDWRSATSRAAVWIAVAAIASRASMQGVTGEGMASVAEIAGTVGSCLFGYVTPAVYFIVLFHLRRPRSIFVTDPSAPSVQSDTLLMRKERQVQRRLSGRRLWQDVCVFGGLLPFGIIVLIRGCFAIANQSN